MYNVTVYLVILPTMPDSWTLRHLAMIVTLSAPCIEFIQYINNTFHAIQVQTLVFSSSTLHSVKTSVIYICLRNLLFQTNLYKQLTYIEPSYMYFWETKEHAPVS